MTKVRVSKQYDWFTTIEKGIKAFCYFGIPLLVGVITKFYPELLSITVGSILVMIENWAKNKKN